VAALSTPRDRDPSRYDRRQGATPDTARRQASAYPDITDRRTRDRRGAGDRDRHDPAPRRSEAARKRAREDTSGAPADSRRARAGGDLPTTSVPRLPPLPAGAPPRDADPREIQNFIRDNQVRFNHAPGEACRHMRANNQCAYNHTPDSVPFGAYPRPLRARAPAALHAPGDTAHENVLHLAATWATWDSAAPAAPALAADGASA